jgi:hypothetical protein
MTARRLARAWAVRLALSLAVALGAAPQALGSGEKGSQSNSSGGNDNSNSSGGSSDGSKNSSNTSEGTSDDSRGSSKNSNHSTQNSPKDTSDYTTNGSSDWTTNSGGAHIFTVVLAVVAVGATVVGMAATHRSGRRQQQTTAALAAFMRRQHALLTHDVTIGEGPVLDAWTYDLGLTPSEKRRFLETLEGSSEQGKLLDALNGPIGAERARQFGAAFMRVTDRALGRPRTHDLVLRAVQATGI